MARATVPAMETIVIAARQVTVTLRPWVEGGCLGRNIRIKLRSRLVVPQNTSNGTPSFLVKKLKLKRGELGSKGQCLHTFVEWNGCIFYRLGRALNFSMAIFGPFWPKLPFGIWQDFLFAELMNWLIYISHICMHVSCLTGFSYFFTFKMLVLYK